MNNKKILEEMNLAISKHETAKKVLINAINRSRLRCSQRWNDGTDLEDLVPNSNVLLLGKSGTGKTYLVETLSRIMDFPLLCIDATSLMPTSAAGGMNVKDVVKAIKATALDYFENSPRNKYYNMDEVIDQMVVFVDEIDKLGLECGNGWNKHTQHNFLTLFENKHEYSSITWIFAGAFTDMRDKRVAVKPIGFKHLKEDKADRDVENEIIKSGLIPELVGRMHTAVELDELTLEDYKQILDDIILPKKVNDCYLMGIDPDELLANDFSAVIKKAHKSEQGVRMLHKEVDRLLIDLEFGASTTEGYKNQGKQKEYLEQRRLELLGITEDVE